MKINITADIPDRWVNCFCTFLKKLERNGRVGHSSTIGFFADGDGDFRPTFDFNDIKFEEIQPDYYGKNYYELEQTYDAG